MNKYTRKHIHSIIDEIQLLPLSLGYRLEDFCCEVQEYTEFLQYNAQNYQDKGIAKTHLLINKKNADIISYMALVTDSIKLSNYEKTEHEMDTIPFGSFPALKIGKLAVDKNYNKRYKGIGFLMIEIARGIAYDINESGVACKFMIIDADTENNSSVLDFYIKNGFRQNEKYKKRNSTVSMRLDIFYATEENYIITGTEN